MAKILKTQNKQWGFWGTAKSFLENKDDIFYLWEKTFLLIKRKTVFSEYDTRKLLDSRYGRHLADYYASEIRNGTFLDIFAKNITSDGLYKSYNYYVAENKITTLSPKNSIETIDWEYIIKNKCPCWFWDYKEHDRIIDTLTEIDDDNYPFMTQTNGYKNCRPVRRNEVTFYVDKTEEI